LAKKADQFVANKYIYLFQFTPKNAWRSFIIRMKGNHHMIRKVLSFLLYYLQ
jgi:hypothetical protein